MHVSARMTSKGQITHPEALVREPTCIFAPADSRAGIQRFRGRRPLSSDPGPPASRMSCECSPATPKRQERQRRRHRPRHCRRLSARQTMRALDTNVLVRFGTADNPPQLERVSALLREASEKQETLYVSLPVVLELMWVLTSTYEVSRDALVAALDQLTQSAFPVASSRSTVSGTSCKNTLLSRLDLADLLVAISGRHAGCSTTLRTSSHRHRPPARVRPRDPRRLPAVCRRPASLTHSIAGDRRSGRSGHR